MLPPFFKENEMTIAELISYVRAEKPNSFSDEYLVKFINEVEAIVMDFLGEEADPYVWPTDQNTELELEPPHSTLYEYWLKARIDFVHEEYQSYTNNQAQFNEDFITWKSDVIRNGKVTSKNPERIKNWW